MVDLLTNILRLVVVGAMLIIVLAVEVLLFVTSVAFILMLLFDLPLFGGTLFVGEQLMLVVARIADPDEGRHR